MIRFALTLFVALACDISCMAQEHIKPYNVPGKMAGIKQPTEMACWITVYTIMTNWKDGKSATVAQTADALGEPWLTYFKTDTGLPPDDEQKFMKQGGLKSEPPASYMLIAYADWLKQHGPVWIVTGGLRGRHARLLTGIDGDGTYDKTDFIFIDPATGTTVKENARKFFDKYEREAKLANIYNWELHLQIFHF
ncbi:papain-like cysteine protease family protein [Mucilaginibacter psychrotolerans]|uniref:Peptidase C39-like domain-containing protein n=1 Tax=Mucilaginibacter psychrotolerans TaxID=1524096 RepID=A0A4Y8SBG9_9SPHI|nr:papain-like cysteine protease family protein [Mucilaginibacter psychrotolerans]TFF36318.1 hypothetical protein E2R66_15900 [Mucilaginibacter psychrotolerans]